MVKPPVRYDREWHRLSHPKFPGTEDALTRTQRRRLQRQRRAAQGYRHGHDNKKEYRPKRRVEQLDEEQQIESMSEGGVPAAAPGFDNQQDKQVNVGMVYVLPAQFRAKQVKQPEMGQGQESRVPSPAGDNPAEGAHDGLIAVGIRVLGSETPSGTVTLTWPPASMLGHVRPLYVKATLDGVPMNKVLVDNGAAINIIPVATRN